MPCALACLGVWGFAAIVQAEPMITIDETEVQKVSAPGEASGKKSGNKVISGDWLEMTATFSLDVPRGTEVEIVEELEFRVYVAALDSLKNDDPITLTGKVVFVNVPVNKDQEVTFYISPSSQVRYGGSKDQENFFKEGQTKDFEVRFEAWINGQMVAEDELVGGYDPGWQNDKPKDGVILSYEKSPWGPFNRIRYPDLKPEGK